MHHYPEAISFCEPAQRCVVWLAPLAGFTWDTYSENVTIRFYLDPTTGLPHIYNHNVEEPEVEQVLRNPDEDRPGTRNSRIAIGHTDGGRILRVIYVRDPLPDSVFVITAYELTGKPLVAFRRRMKKKWK